MNAVSIATLALSALYLIITYGKFGLTASVSETFYRWQTKNYSAAFVWFCLVVAAGALLQMIYPYKDITKLLLMLAGFAMFCIGIASTFRDKKVSTLHYVLAVLAICLGFSAVAFEHWQTWRSWVPVASLVVLSAVARRFWKPYLTYLVEVFALVLIFSFL